MLRVRRTTTIAKQENLTEVKNLWPLLFLSLPAIQFFRGANLLTGVLLTGWVLYALSFLFRTPRRIPMAVAGLIAGSLDESGSMNSTSVRP